MVPSFPSCTRLRASIRCGVLRRCVPTWTTRLYLRAAASTGHAGSTEAQTPDQQGWYGKNHRRNKRAVGKGQSGQGATGENFQEGCPEEGRWHEGDADKGGKAEWPGQENCGEKDGPGFYAGGNGSFCSVGFRNTRAFTCSVIFFDWLTHPPSFHPAGSAFPPHSVGGCEDRLESVSCPSS